MAGKCEECGCICAKCARNNEKHADMHLHAEIENLRQRLMERDTHIVKMETQFLNEADKFPNGELASMKEEARAWQEKYTRLYEAHKRVQKVNQNLEDKLLRIVDKCETEKGAFAKDIATLSHRLADANYTIHRLTQDNEKYRNDVNLAIQLLQCKPSNFVGQKYDSLPSEVQAKVRTYVAQKRRSSDASPPEVKSITVPISTFPPTAMVYNITKASVEKHSDDESDDSKNPVDVVSAAIMAKVLEDRERERIFAKHCNSCTCHRTILTVDSETQTTLDKYDKVRICDECDSREYERALEECDRSSNIETTKARQTLLALESTNGKFDVSASSRSSNDLKTIRGGRSDIIEENCTNVNTKINASLKKIVAVQKHIQLSTKQKSIQASNDRATTLKSNASRIKQTRLSKRIDLDADKAGRDISENWQNFDDEASPTTKRENETKNDTTTEEEPSPIDIINDRIWKSSWNAKLLSNSNDDIVDSDDKRSGNTEIDVINNRVWRNVRAAGNINNTKMTLIEVTNAVNSPASKDFQQPEVATSPSFSSDSVVISTSNKSSSSSDALHAINDKRSFNNNHAKSSWKERSGPRNCFMRLTPGSKNILLDNVGQYQTVLYTSGTNRPNAALVHAAKSTRSARSMSTSSEENLPVVNSNDNTQLQRVAEWVQSSVGVSKNDKTAKSNNCRDKTSRQKIVNARERSQNDTLVKIDLDDNVDDSLIGTIDNANLEEIVVVEGGTEKSVENPFSDDSRIVQDTSRPNETTVIEDLISFDTCCQTNDETIVVHSANLSNDKKEANYEVKITKEMEEIYLKLAASLDPVSLRLSSPTSADLTIEKYRKDRRIHVQKFQEKPK